MDPASGTNMGSILVVDDEPDIVRVIVKMLAERGHDVTTAVDGQEALERAKRNPPDVIILDLKLPGMDGNQVCRLLKKDSVTKNIPVIMMTSEYISLDDARRREEFGADDYVIKPFMQDVLVRNVERLIPDRNEAKQ